MEVLLSPLFEHLYIQHSDKHLALHSCIVMTEMPAM